MLEVGKEIGGGDEAAFTQVIEEDGETKKYGQLHEEATTTIRRLNVLLEIHHEKKDAAKDAAEPGNEENPEEQTEMESTTISPESWKTPAESDEVISGLSLEDGSKDSELSWVGTALEDGSKVASWVRNESRCPDLAEIDCAEAVTEL